MRLWGDSIDVTLIDRLTTYQSSIVSSLVLTGQRSMGSLSFNHDNLRSRYGSVFGEVKSVDPVAMKVPMGNGTVLTVDRIVIAPGIDFDTVPGLGTSYKMPHAWKAGPQTMLLAKQLAAMPNGGRVILTIRKTPYRCHGALRARLPDCRLVVGE